MAVTGTLVCPALGGKVSTRILMIDDEVDLLDSLQALLSSESSYEVVTCSTPLQAYEECMKGQFDLIISDHNMKDLNGLELLKVLRADGHMTPFILLTGCASKDIAINALKLGASDILEKPVEINQIKVSIARTLELEKSRYLFYKSLNPESQDSKTAQSQFSSRLGNLLASTKIAKAG